MVEGITIADYRSIGEAQRIAPLGKINLFVGGNNSGKSNILRFVNENLVKLYVFARKGKPPITSTPHLQRGRQSSAQLRVKATVKELMEALNIQNSSQEPLVAKLHHGLTNDGAVWIGDGWPSPELLKSAHNCLNKQEWEYVWNVSTNKTGGSLDQHWIPETLVQIRKLVPENPSVFAIPIQRRAGTKELGSENSESHTLLGGEGAIRALAAMQNPVHADYEESRQRFLKIQEFVRIVTDDPTAEISVTHKQDEVLVKLEGQSFLPLADLGSGIEQVVLHAVAATSASDAVITFEEPELHLHPVLQRQLLRYLSQTSNQYFIATHSAHLIDVLHVNTFHVRLEDKQTVVEAASTDAKRHLVCHDLGYRPSDIVQSNCIIWVEGPSDRVYIQHWIEQHDAHLREGIHYSVMFYGGKLLSHLSAAATDAVVDEGLKDLISLRNLNRHVAVVIDSDKTKPREKPRTTKKRVVDEIGEHGGFVWVTKGREIENYVPHKTLVAAVDAVAPGRGKACKAGQYEKALPTRGGPKSATVDKIASAREVVKLGCDLSMYDLKKRVKELASFIRRANGLTELK